MAYVMVLAVEPVLEGGQRDIGDNLQPTLLPPGCDWGIGSVCQHSMLMC